MFPIHSLKDNLISASPFLVSLPFTINGASKFEVSEEQALYQPPGYVFGIVWTTLYILQFMMNTQIILDKTLSDSFKDKMQDNCLF